MGGRGLTQRGCLYPAARYQFTIQYADGWHDLSRDPSSRKVHGQGNRRLLFGGTAERRWCDPCCSYRYGERPTAGCIRILLAGGGLWFFQGGALGYSETRTAGRYDGLELHCDHWKVEPLEVEHIESSYFADKAQFPQGSVDFDCGLLMRNIPHQWLGHEDLFCATAAET
jgi:hypothetical protein